VSDGQMHETFRGVCGDPGRHRRVTCCTCRLSSLVLALSIPDNKAGTSNRRPLLRKPRKSRQNSPSWPRSVKQHRPWDVLKLTGAASRNAPWVSRIGGGCQGSPAACRGPSAARTRTSKGSDQRTRPRMKRRPGINYGTWTPNYPVLPRRPSQSAHTGRPSTDDPWCLAYDGQRHGTNRHPSTYQPSKTAQN
jgi:hypothetical protein